MKIFISVVVLFLVGVIQGFGTTFISDGSSADTQAKVNLAAAGDTVRIPAGNFTWTSKVACSKAITIQGAGSHRALGYSYSSVSVGTGSKTFTTQSGLPISNGDTVRVERTGTPQCGDCSNNGSTGVRTWMQGSVTSYTGTTLQINATSSAGSGTEEVWTVLKMSATPTVITNSNAYQDNGIGGTFQLTESTTGSLDLSNICFILPSGKSEAAHLMRGQTNAKPMKLHDLYVEDNSGGGGKCMFTRTNRGVIYNCTFMGLPYAFGGVCIHSMHNPDDAWTTLHKWGATDTAGNNALFFEDCWFSAFINATDFDSSSKTVVRYSTFDSAGLGSHGPDDGQAPGGYGNRTTEVYNCRFVYKASLASFPIKTDRWAYMRGGSWLFTDNDIVAMNSGYWGSKNTFKLETFVLSMNGGQQYRRCWGANRAGVQYPAPRQLGRGYVDGTSLDGYGNSVGDGVTTGDITIPGDLEPMYFWNNTGTGASIFGWSSGPGDSGCSNLDNGQNYVVEGRDFFKSAKPGYQKLVYPHPLRGGSAPSAPQNLRVATPTPTP